MKNFEDYAYYYNVFYGDKDYSGEAKTVDSLLKAHSFSSSLHNILDIG